MSDVDVSKFLRELQDPRHSPADQAHLIAEAMRVIYGLEIDESRLMPPSARTQWRGEVVPLVDFLLARLAEDEAVVESIDAGDRPWQTGRAHVLAEVAAKRRIVNIHGPEQGGDVCDEWEAWPCLTIRLLAQPYADHPDFDPAWRVEVRR